MNQAEQSYASRLKRAIQAERRRTANPFLRERIEDTYLVATRTEERVRAVEDRLSLLEIGLARLENRLLEFGAVVQNDTQAMAAVALGLQQDIDLLTAALGDVRSVVPERAHESEDWTSP